MVTMKSACEDDTHRLAGHCTPECAWLVQEMSDGYGGGDDRIYGDYLGGTSSIDWSGCHRGPSMPEQVVEYDAVNRAVVIRTIHPEDCQCAEHEYCTMLRDNGVCGEPAVVGVKSRGEICYFCADCAEWGL